MTCYPCPKEDRAEALAADSRRQIDAAWARMRLVYLQARAAGIEVGDQQMRDHFGDEFVHREHAQRCSDALEAFHRSVLDVVHQLEVSGMDPAAAWQTFTVYLSKRWPRHPAAAVSMRDCRDAVRARFAKVAEDCPPPDDPTDPYGTPPLLGVEWSEQVTGRRIP